MTKREGHPELEGLIPHPDDITLDKSINGGIITDTYNAARLMNSLTSKEINGKTHKLLCQNHLRSVWVKTP